MRLAKFNSPVIKSLIVAVVVFGLAQLGLSVSRQTVEEVVDQGFLVVQDEEVGVDDKEAASEAGGLYPVMAVIDGDTIMVQTTAGSETVRVVGVDTPETEHAPGGAECYGAEASSFTKGLLSGQTVSLARDYSQAERDKYGRLLAYVTLADGRDLGELLIKAGYAREYTYLGVVYDKQSVYRSAENSAQAAGSGLWGACDY